MCICIVQVWEFDTETQSCQVLIDCHSDIV